MASGITESISSPPESSSSVDNGSNDAGDFECNICFEFAQDPIVTLCGHLFCWPCLYKWLHLHSHSQECPVCKALIQEEKLVPLYGRGKTSTDPRSKPIPGLEIPNRPAAQRPPTAPPPEANNLTFGFGLMGVFVPIATTRFGIGGLLPSLLDIHVHGFQGAPVHGARTHHVHGFPGAFHGGHAHENHQTSAGQQDINLLNLLFLMFGAMMIMYLIL